MEAGPEFPTFSSGSCDPDREEEVLIVSTAERKKVGTAEWWVVSGGGCAARGDVELTNWVTLWWY